MYLLLVCRAVIFAFVRRTTTRWVTYDEASLERAEAGACASVVVPDVLPVCVCGGECSVIAGPRCMAPYAECGARHIENKYTTVKCRRSRKGGMVAGGALAAALRAAKQRLWVCSSCAQLVASRPTRPTGPVVRVPGIVNREQHHQQRPWREAKRLRTDWDGVRTRLNLVVEA